MEMSGSAEKFPRREGGVAVEVVEFGGIAGKKPLGPKKPKGPKFGPKIESVESTEEGFTSISKTKVTTTIEKSKYVGPCGSACTYSGDLVKLYRSYNDKVDVNDHFYTTDRLEHHLMVRVGWTKTLRSLLKSVQFRQRRDIWSSHTWVTLSPIQCQYHAKIRI